MGWIRGDARTEVSASIEAVYEVAANAEGAPRWQSEIDVAECIERDRAGNQVRVRIETETPIRRLTSVLVYSYRAPTRIDWTQEEGDLKAVEGSWELHPLADGRTVATYRLGVDPGRILGMALRGPVVGLLRGRMVDTMPGKLKAFVEEGA
ncbi:MAG: type II toxin-antitoxin system RatA family toxin [Syntrophothermus sp.]